MSDITERGLLGDRAYALVDVETGKVVSAKNPRKWPKMFEFRAAFVEELRSSESIPAARIIFPAARLPGPIKRTLTIAFPPRSDGPFGSHRPCRTPSDRGLLARLRMAGQSRRGF